MSVIVIEINWVAAKVFNKQFISCVLKFCCFKDFIHDPTSTFFSCQRTDALPENVQFPDTTQNELFQPSSNLSSM